MFTVLKKEGYMHGILAMVLCLACIIAMLNGYKWSYLQSAMINKISSSMEAVLIFITVGMLVAMWISGGIVQAMIYYGLKILSPQIFLVASCISVSYTHLYNRFAKKLYFIVVSGAFFAAMVCLLPYQNSFAQKPYFLAQLKTSALPAARLCYTGDI